MLGCFVTYWAADAGSLSGWGAVIAFAIFMSVLAVQIGGLRHVHRYSVWKHVYPLPDKQRVEQLLRVDRMVMLVCAFIMWLFAAIPLALSQVYIPSAAAAVAIIAYLLLRPARLRKKIEHETEEE
ncbi:Bacterial ABC transporter protein EcsB [compost metagenome]